jgi:uncharacterized protein with PIN domain
VEGPAQSEEDETMRIHQTRDHATAFAGCFAFAARCPECGDRMVAPESSEFVDSGKIRHHWLCDACAHEFSTTVCLDPP